MLQSEARAWDSLYGCYGVCMKWFWPRRTNGLSCATQSAGMPCFVQYNGVFVNGEVLKVVRSCLSSVMMFGMCSTSLSKLVLAEM